MSAKKVKKTKAPNFRYVMEVVEERHYTTAIDCDERMTIDELKDIAESRRVAGELSFKAVTEVDSWCDETYAKGRKCPQASAIRD